KSDQVSILAVFPVLSDERAQVSAPDALVRSVRSLGSARLRVLAPLEMPATAGMFAGTQAEAARSRSESRLEPKFDDRNVVGKFVPAADGAAVVDQAVHRRGIARRGA